jgi:hypothetical protein
VAHIADDDLWFPDHLETLEQLLETCDFGNTLHFYLDKNGKSGIHLYDLSDVRIQQRMNTLLFNIFGPTFVGYSVESYRKLAEGWAPAPDDVWTDLWMWRKFLQQDGLRFATEFKITAISLPAALRLDSTLDERYEEMKTVWDEFKQPNFRAAHWRVLLTNLAKEKTDLLYNAR